MNRKSLIGYIIMIAILLGLSGCTYGKSLDKTKEEIRYLAYVYVQGDEYETILNGDRKRDHGIHRQRASHHGERIHLRSSRKSSV